MSLILRIKKPKAGRLHIKVGHEANDGRSGMLEVTIGEAVACTRRIALYHDLPLVEVWPVPTDGKTYRVVATLGTEHDEPKSVAREMHFPG